MPLLSEENDNSCKVLLLGSLGCGKSCLLWRLLKNTFNQHVEGTVGAAFATKRMNTENGAVNLCIWDTSGQERFRSLVKLYYRDAKAAVLCCDLTESSSFYDMEHWLKELRDHEKHCKVYICGTKLDLIQQCVKNRAVTVEDLRIFNGEFMETSSKSGYNVEDLFQRIATEYTSAERVTKTEKQVVRLQEKPLQPSRKCCGTE